MDLYSTEAGVFETKLLLGGRRIATFDTEGHREEAEMFAEMGNEQLDAQCGPGSLTIEDDAMLQEIEQSDSAFVDRVVDEVWEDTKR